MRDEREEKQEREGRTKKGSKVEFEEIREEETRESIYGGVAVEPKTVGSSGNSSLFTCLIIVFNSLFNH